MGRTLRLLALAGAAAAALGALWPVDGLEIVNAARGQRWRLAMPSGGSFAITSHHSMYDQPYTETFAVDGQGRIVLREVSSPNAAVREYLGFTGAGEHHAADRVLPELVLRVAAGPAQQLRVGKRERSFLTLGEHGDRLVVRAVRRPAVVALIERNPSPPEPSP